MLNESFGVLTDPEKTYDRLVKLITDYIYDLEGGLNNYIDLYPSETPIITPSILKSYWKYKNNKLFDETIIPKWMGNFTIIVEPHVNQNYVAYFQDNTAVLNKDTGRIDFTICITDKADKSYNVFYRQLTHEFRHAYTKYIKLTNNIGISSKNDRELYSIGLKYAKANYPLIKKWDEDYIIPNNKILSDEDFITATIFKTLYYLNAAEIQSFLQEYAGAVNNLIGLHQNQAREAFQQSAKLKEDYKNHKRRFIQLTNVSHIFPITCRCFDLYRIYSVLRDFWHYGLYRIDPDLLDDIILKNREVFIKIFKTRNIHINIQGDGLKLLSKLAESYTKVLEKILKKMQNIFYSILYEYGTSEEKNNKNIPGKIDKIINDDIILDYDFELDIMRTLSEIKQKIK